MNITLEANPPDAPCCIKIVAEDGRDRLIQTDWDFPGIASAFGWSTRHAPNQSTLERDIELGDACCGSNKTDGTISCPDCGKSPNEFITEARQWIDDNDGAEVEDPGYFDNE